MCVFLFFFFVPLVDVLVNREPKGYPCWFVSAYTSSPSIAMHVSQSTNLISLLVGKRDGKKKKKGKEKSVFYV